MRPTTSPAGWTRRQMFRAAKALGLGSLVPTSALAATQGAAGVRRASAAPAMAAGPSGKDLYAALGVRPIINARGTFTIIGGSVELPEVRAAKAAANQHYANFEELMDAAGKRLAELTGAEWGMVSWAARRRSRTRRRRASRAAIPTCTCGCPT